MLPVPKRPSKNDTPTPTPCRCVLAGVSGHPAANEVLRKVCNFMFFALQFSVAVRTVDEFHSHPRNHEGTHCWHLQGKKNHSTNDYVCTGILYTGIIYREIHLQVLFTRYLEVRCLDFATILASQTLPRPQAARIPAWVPAGPGSFFLVRTLQWDPCGALHFSANLRSSRFGRLE